MTGDDYGRQLGQLLPPGAAWTQDPDSVLQQLLRALGQAYGRAHRRADDLYRETDVGEAFETLSRWEAALGLPDECSVLGSQTVQERVSAALAKLVSLGGQSRAYFLALADALGYPNATITEYQSRRHGRARMGGLYGSDEWEDAWQLNLPETLVIERRHGRAAMGEQYRVWGDAQLECVMHKHKPAGSFLIFSYGGN
ncbi:YmfQ family protein [Aquipseudomonas campi]